MLTMCTAAIKLPVMKIKGRRAHLVHRDNTTDTHNVHDTDGTDDNVTH